jgi:hypothetical protein
LETRFLYSFVWNGLWFDYVFVKKVKERKREKFKLSFYFNRINIINDNDTYSDLIDDESLNDEISNDKTRLFVSKRLNYLLSLLSVIGIIIYILFIFFCSNKQEYENLHAYLTILPVSKHLSLLSIQ